MPDEQDSTAKVTGVAVLERFSGDAVRMAEHLANVLNDNHDLREKNRTLARTNDDLKKQVPAEGATVLTGNDAAAWQAYQGLELKPDEIATRLKDAETTAADLAKARKADQVREVASLAGWKPEVLTRYGGDLDYEIKDIDQGGTKVKQAFVKDGDQVKPVAEHFADLLPALQAAPEGTRFPVQHSGDAPKSLLDQFKERRDAEAKARPNPLIPT